MATQPNLRVRISADLADIKQGLGVLRGELAKVRQQNSQAADTRAWSEGLASVKRQLAGIVSVYAALRAGRWYTDQADQAANLAARLKLATKSQEEFSKAQQGTYQIAQRTSAEWGSVVALYAQLAQTTGMGQERILALTETISQAFQVSGASAEETSIGLRQLQQAMAGGVLRAEEFNTIIETSPRIVQALADHFGIAFGQVRKYVNDGKISSAEFARALESASAAVQQDFDKLPVTISRATQQVRNALLSLVSSAEEANGSTGELAKGVQQLVRSLESQEVRQGFTQLVGSLLGLVNATARFMAQDGAKYLRQLGEAALFVVEHLDVLIVALGTHLAITAVTKVVGGITATIAALRALQASIAATTLSAKGLTAAMATMGGPISLAIAAVTAVLYALYKRTTDAKRAADEHAEALKNNATMAHASRDAALADAKAKREQALATLRAAQAVLEERKARLQAAQDRLSKSTGRAYEMNVGIVARESTGVENANKAIQEAERQYEAWGKRLVELAMQVSDDVLTGTAVALTEPGQAIAKSTLLMRDAVARALAELDRLYEEHKISIGEYYQTRQRLAEQAIDLEIEQARSEMALTEDLGARRKLEEQIIILQRDRAELAGKAAREQQKAEEELAASLADVELQLMRLNGKTAAAERASLETTYKALKEQLQRSGNEAGVATVNALIDGLVARAQSEELKEAASRIGAALQGAESSLSAQAAAGMLGGVESERRLAEARSQALAQYRELRDKAIAYLQSLDPNSPEAANARLMLQQINNDVLAIITSQDKLRQNVSDAGKGAFEGLFTGLREGVMSTRELLEQFALDFVTLLYDMQAKANASKLGDIIGSWFGAKTDEADVAAGALALQSAATSTGVAGGVVQTAATTLGTSAAALMAAAQALAAANAMGGVGGMPVGVAHTGAMVGQWKMRRTVSPLLFGNAPRYHTGSARLGLRPGEHPAILKDKERVLNEHQNLLWEKMLKDGGRGGETGLSVQINIQNSGSTPLAAETTDVQFDGKTLILNMVAADVANGGVVGQAVSQRTGTSYRGVSRG